MRKWAAQFRKWFAEVSDLPEDIVTGLPRITLIGRSHLSVENHNGVVSFTENKLILALQQGTLTVTGKEFILEGIAEGQISLHGMIQGISFAGAREEGAD